VKNLTGLREKTKRIISRNSRKGVTSQQIPGLLRLAVLRKEGPRLRHGWVGAILPRRPFRAAAVTERRSSAPPALRGITWRTRSAATTRSKKIAHDVRYASAWQTLRLPRCSPWLEGKLTRVKKNFGHQTGSRHSGGPLAAHQGSRFNRCGDCPPGVKGSGKRAQTSEQSSALSSLRSIATEGPPLRNRRGSERQASDFRPPRGTESRSTAPSATGGTGRGRDLAIAPRAMPAKAIGLKEHEHVLASVLKAATPGRSSSAVSRLKEGAATPRTNSRPGGSWQAPCQDTRLGGR
jgi:hypothetical protein